MKSRDCIFNVLKMFLVIVCAVVCLDMFAGCSGVKTKEPENVEDRSLIEYKRGRLRGPQYFNEYFKFQITTPRGWRAMRTRDEYLVRMTPPQQEARIEIIINEYKKPQDLQNISDEIVKKRELELISGTPGTFLEFPAFFAEYQYISGIKTYKIEVLFIQKENFVYEIYLTCDKENFDNYVQSFEDAKNSIRFTEKFIEELGHEDYFSYLVKSDDSLSRLANTFLNDPDQDKMIAYFNQLTALVPNRPIDIPRFVVYEVQEGDTEEGISQKLYNVPDQFNLVKEYNPNMEPAELLTPGMKIKCPMYFNYTVEDGDSLPELAKKYLRTENRAELIYIYNDKTALKPGSVIKMPILWRARDYVIYVVKRDDSLSSIAENQTGQLKNYLVLAEFNNIQPPYELTIGQKIKIPKDIYREKPKTKPKTQKPKAEEEIPIEEEIEGPIYEPD